MSENRPTRSLVRRVSGTIAIALIAVAAVAVGTLVTRHTPPVSTLSQDGHYGDGYAVGNRIGGAETSHNDTLVLSDDPFTTATSGDDGILPVGATVFDGEYPGVANLDPALLAALRRATADAANDGVALYLSSGWRSAEYQNQLLDKATLEYGSLAEALRWVATADTSAHVSGTAADLEGADAFAAQWLSEHAAEHGLCPVYRNEPWHYELQARATDHGCPPPYDDPTSDPRMLK